MLPDWLAHHLLLESNTRRKWAGVTLDLLEHPEFEDLDDATKWHIVGLMLYVKRTGFNHLPNNPDFLRRKIAAKSQINIENLLTKKFLIPAKRKRTKGDDCAQNAHKTRTPVYTATDTATATASHTPTATETRAADADAGAVVGVASKFSLEECRAYANHLHLSGAGITNPGGYAKAIYRSGEDDDQIEAFLLPSSDSNNGSDQESAIDADEIERLQREFDEAQEELRAQ